MSPEQGVGVPRARGGSRATLEPMTTMHPDALTWASPRRRWPLTAVAAGALGLAAGLLEGHPSAAPLGWSAAALLLLTAAQWRRWVEPRTKASTAAHAVPFGLLVAAAGLAYGLSWTALSGVAVAAAAMAWMGLRERTVSRAVAVVSLGPPALSLVLLAAAGAGRPDLVDPVVGAVLAGLWLVAAGLGLALGRSTIAR